MWFTISAVGLKNRPSARMNRNHVASSIGLFLACAIGTMAAQAVGPTGDYKIKPEHNFTSPDGTTTVEQYAKIDADGDYTWQFWARHQDKLTLLKPEQAHYAAGFRFTSDSQWLVRIQKTGSGESTLYLYRLGPQGFVPATKKPLGDLAWAYFKSRPEWRKVKKDPECSRPAPLARSIRPSRPWRGSGRMPSSSLPTRSSTAGACNLPSWQRAIRFPQPSGSATSSRSGG